MKVNANLHFDFLVASISKRFDIADLKLPNKWIHDWNITIVFCFDLEIIPSIKCEDFGERNLMKLWEYDHITGICLSLPVQLDGIRLKKEEIKRLKSIITIKVPTDRDEVPL